MSEPTPIRIPMDNLNDEVVKLVAWRVKEGQEVQEGQLLAEVETSKALVEMMAPVSGKVWIKVQAGAEVPVGQVVAFITTNGFILGGQPSATQRGQVALDGEATRSSSAGPLEIPEATSFSKKARELLERHRILPGVFAGRGLVREQDVKEYLANQEVSASPAQEMHFALKGLPLDQITFPRIFSDLDRGRVDPDFLENLKGNPETFAALSSREKCELYRKNGAAIGDGAFLGQGSIVIAPQIVIGEEAEIAENSSIVCRERFCVGALTTFCRHLTVRGGTVVFGENVWAGQNIQIGGGGHADPWSLLCVGDTSYLGDDVYLNICRPILIGAGVFLTLRSVIMTHNVGHSVLEGYENRFAPVILGDYSQIGMCNTIYAGSIVGRSAIVLSNSNVVSSVPAGKLAGGVPARVIRDAARPLDRARQLQIVETMVREYHEVLQLKGHQVSLLESSPYLRFQVEHLGQRFQLVFVEKFPVSGHEIPTADQTVVWTFDFNDPPLPDGCTLMNLLAKEVIGPMNLFSNSSREFLRKRGIRCTPAPWRYRKGLL